MRTTIYAVCFLLWGLITGPALAGELRGYFADFSDPAVLWDIDTESALLSLPEFGTDCAFDPENTVFGVNYTAGLAFKAREPFFGLPLLPELFGIEWENGGGPDIYLYSFSADPCITGTRVGGPIGHVGLQSLAFCEHDGYFYSVDWDGAPPHLGQLVRIDPTTGLGTLVGNHMAPDVRVNGMMCDLLGQLWAVTSGFGGPAGRNPELLKIDRNTGVETVVGELGLGPNEVESLASDPDAPRRLFAAGKALYQVDVNTGEATLVGGSFGQFWAAASAVADLIFRDRFDPDSPD